MSKQHYDPHPHPPNPEYNHSYNPPSNHLASSDKAGSSQEQHSSSTTDVNTNTNMNLIDEGGEFDSDSESLWDELNIAKTHEIQQHRNRTSNNNNNNTVTSANTANIGTATSSGTVTHDDQLQVHHRAHGHLSSGNQNQNHTNNYYVSHAGHLRPNHQQYEHQHGHGRQTVQEEVSNFITQTASNVSNLASLGMNKVSYAYHHYQQPKPLFPHHTIIDPTTSASATSATTAIGHRNRRGTRIETNHSHQGYHYQQSGNYISPFQDFGLETSNTGTSALHHETSTRTFTSTSTSTSTSIPPNTTARSTGTRTGTDTGTAHHYTQIQNNHYYEESSNTNPLLPKNEHGHESFVEIDEDRDVQGGNKKFILLNQFRLTPKRDGWGAVANLDLFFTSMYNYYYHRGIVPILGKGVVELISLFFTLWLSVFLFAYLDWKLLFSCTDKNSCLDSLSDYIIDKPFEEASIYNFLIILYIILFSVYGIVSLASFYSTIRDALEAKYIYEDKLGISSRKLEGGVIEWHEIIHKILMLQQSGEYRIAIHSTDIKDELIIAQRILRRENFMIAFFNRGLLDLTIPLPSSSSLLLSLLCWGRWRTTTTTSLEGRRSKTMFYSKSMEWSIYFCVLSYMFNHKYQIRPAFCMDPLALQRRFVVCGIAHTIFMPFLLLFMTLHFFMQNVYDFRSTKQYLGPREWSNVAKWTFRELNELPHVFERRISPSYQAADKYLQLFVASSIFNSIGRILVFLSGSLGAVCLALAAVNDAILLHVKLGHWNLLWYVGILGATYTVGKGMLPPTETEMTSAVKNKKSSHRNVFAEMDAALVEVTSHTHHYPEFWRKRGWDDIIKNSLLELYQYKVQLFMLEVVSVIVAPIVLCFSLPRCAIRICSFVNRIKIEVPGTGDHCGFATFDFDMFEDENWEGQQINNANGTTTTTSDNDRVGISAQLNLPSERPKAKGGKMEKSFFNFKVSLLCFVVNYVLATAALNSSRVLHMFLLLLLLHVLNYRLFIRIGNALLQVKISLIVWRLTKQNKLLHWLEKDSIISQQLLVN